MKAREKPEACFNSLKAGKLIHRVTVRHLFRESGAGITVQGNVETLVIDMRPRRGPRAGRKVRVLALAAIVLIAVAASTLFFYPSSGASNAAAATELGGSHLTIATGLHSNGTYDVFGIDKAGQVIHSVMGTTTGDWGPWTEFGPDSERDGTVAAIAAAADSDQLLHVMAVMADGSIEQRSELSLDHWGNWESFAPAGTAKAVALGLDRHDLLNVFAVSPSGKLLTRTQAAPDSTSWAGWTQQALDAPVKSVAATRKVDKYLDVLVVLADGAVEWEDENRVGFRPWVQLGPPGTAVQVSLSENPNGTDEAFALTPDGTISNDYQEDASGRPWSGWLPDFQPGRTAESVNVGAQYGQRLSVLVLGTDGTIRFVFQVTAGGPWHGDWKSFGPVRDFGGTASG